ncbi:MAG: hypothetical protein KKF89_01065 [Nanoarchaeota archaeon]|nr:hypothetical protein [Nanoarchaeota archaeon]MBU1854288.1 hypothetical protein [Nanoarchaeota archaeon]
MLLKKAIEKIESSKAFKDFKEENPEFYLAHAFTIIDKIQQEWQVGYYGKKRDKVVVFITGETITKSPEEEIFKKPGHHVKELDLKKVKLTLETAINKAEELVKKKYSAEIVNKIICILQNLETELYNLTLITQAFNIINIRIDAKNGEVLRESRQSILGLKKS